MLLVGAATMVTDLAPEKRRGEALSLYSLGLWGGLALGPILGELVLGGDRFDAVWLLAAGFCLVAAAIGLDAAGDRTESERSARRSRPRDSSIRRRSDPGLVLALTVLGFAGLGTFAALYARELGMDGAGRGVPRLLGGRRRDADRRAARFRTGSGRSAPRASRSCSSRPAC